MSFFYFRLIHLFPLLVCHLPSPAHSAVDEATRCVIYYLFSCVY